MNNHTNNVSQGQSNLVRLSPMGTSQQLLNMSSEQYNAQMKYASELKRRSIIKTTGISIAVVFAILLLVNPYMIPRGYYSNGVYHFGIPPIQIVGIWAVFEVLVLSSLYAVLGYRRQIILPTRQVTWQQLAKEIGGNFESGNNYSCGIVRYNSGDWAITLDAIIHHHSSSHGSSRRKHIVTHMRAPFVNKHGLYFKVTRVGSLTGILKRMGMQDITVSNPAFDQDYLVKGNDLSKIKTIFSDPELQNLIWRQFNFHFEIRKSEDITGKGQSNAVDELYFESYGQIKDDMQLRSLFDMFTLTLEKLVQIGSADARGPHAGLYDS